MHKGLTVWFTGLPCSGKSTIAEGVGVRLANLGYPIEMIDGDVIRQTLGQGLGFSRADRDANVQRVGFVAEMLTRHGIIVLVSLVSPYRAARDDVHVRIGSNNFLEVFVDAPLPVCEKRDVKGLYKRFRAGEFTGMTGIDDPYEPPLSPDVTCYTGRESIMTCVDRVYLSILRNVYKHPLERIPYETLP
jgi:adenylylsulfate kinase